MIFGFFSYQRIIVGTCAALAAVCAVVSVHQSLTINHHDRTVSHHVARKEVILGEIKSHRSRLSSLGSNLLLTEYLQSHPSRVTNDAPAPHELADLRDEITGTFTANYLKENDGDKLQIIYDQIENIPGWAVAELSASPSRQLAKIRALSELAGFDDISLIDFRTGRIVMTGERRFDLGASLLSEPLISSELGSLFGKIDTTSTDPILSDLAEHEPYIANSQMLMATPVISPSGKLEGVLVGHISTFQIDSWVNRNGQWTKLGYQSDEQSYILGSDGVIRSQWRPFAETPDRFIQDVAKLSGTKLAAKLLARKSTAGIVKINDEKILSYLGRLKPALDKTINTNFVVEQLPIKGISWNLVTETRLMNFSWYWALGAGVFACFGFILSFWYHRQYELTLDKLETVESVKRLANEEHAKARQRVAVLNAKLEQSTKTTRHLKQRSTRRRMQLAKYIGKQRIEAKTLKVLFKRECDRADQEFAANLELNANLRDVEHRLYGQVERANLLQQRESELMQIVSQAKSEHTNLKQESEDAKRQAQQLNQKILQVNKEIQSVQQQHHSLVRAMRADLDTCEDLMTDVGKEWQEHTKATVASIQDYSQQLQKLNFGISSLSVQIRSLPSDEAKPVTEKLMEIRQTLQKMQTDMRRLTTQPSPNAGLNKASQAVRSAQQSLGRSS